MQQLVRICYAAETKSEALRQLFTVLARERKDILADAMIGNPDNPLLVALFTTVRNTYRLKDS
jgi:mannitol/fructose-specific phosphotransferase system IIA component (Ntr-type)